MSEIVGLCDQYEPDILIFAESGLDENRFLDEVNKGRSQKYFSGLNLSGRLRFFSKFSEENFSSLYDDDYFSIKLVRPYLGPGFLLVGVHLPSKLHAGPIDQLYSATFLSQTIREHEKKLGIDRTVVVGDFNMSPFEDGMVAASALHAVMDKGVARKGFRTLKGKKHPFFYNPMWGRQGDLTIGPPGTFRYSKSQEVNHYWHTYDQVLVRPSLFEVFPVGALEVVSSSFSDHSPIFFKIDSEELI